MIGMPSSSRCAAGCRHSSRRNTNTPGPARGHDPSACGLRQDGRARPGEGRRRQKMDALIFLGRTLGFSFAAGINLYATVALLGLASRYGWVALPPEYQVFDNSWIIGTALFLYAIEFFADKIPWIDSAWDTLHTFIRPLGGALIALTALGEAS